MRPSFTSMPEPSVAASMSLTQSCGPALPMSRSRRRPRAALLARIAGTFGAGRQENGPYGRDFEKDLEYVSPNTGGFVHC